MGEHRAFPLRGRKARERSRAGWPSPIDTPSRLHYACIKPSDRIHHFQMRGIVSRLLFPLALGTGLGLLYGWVIQPAQVVDVTPASLRADYRNDYVLIVAEAFAGDQNTALAAERLGILGTERPDEIVLAALEYARQHSFTAPEVDLLQQLLTAMQTYEPSPAQT